MRTYDFDFYFTTPKGNNLWIEYTGEIDTTRSKIGGRWCVSIDFINSSVVTRDVIQECAENLYDEIHDAAVNDFITRMNIKQTS